MNYESFLTYLKTVEQKVLRYIIDDYKRKRNLFQPQLIDNTIMSYINSGGKRLRPAVSLMACGAVGGEEDLAIPVAAAIEVFHTWTLVHDDLIDSDELRRGQPTVHMMAKEIAIERYRVSESQAIKYGQDIAVLTGDVQHGWSISMLTDENLLRRIDSEVILRLISKLETNILCTLVHGEVLDVDFGIQDNGVLDISEEDIINMLWMKTGVLFEFAGMAGAMVGKNSTNFDDPEISAIGRFCSNCGTAFQLKDDILGILGKETDLGKPVGSDIREGKKTTIIRTALLNATEVERQFIQSVLGNPFASEADIKKLTKLLIDLGGVQHTYELAVKYVEQALPYLSKIPSSDYKSLLEQWAFYLIERNF